MSNCGAHHSTDIDQMTDTELRAWIDRLVQTCLPIELQKKLLSLQPLTKEEANRYADVVSMVAQAKQLSNQSEIFAKLDTLIRDNRRNGNLIRETLWHASGKLPQYKPTDGRSIGVIKEGMVQTAIDRILSGTNQSPRAILTAIIDQYSSMPGAYRELTPFLRQVERELKKTKHNLKDMF